MNSINILTGTQFECKLYQDTDFSLLYKLLSDVSPMYPKFEAWLNFTFRRNLASGQRKIILAHDENKVIGVALLKQDDVESKICTFYVSPEYRNRGIGKELIDLAMETLDSADTFITVGSERKDELTPLLNSRGFEIVSEHPGLYRKNSTEYVFSI